MCQPQEAQVQQVESSASNSNSTNNNINNNNNNTITQTTTKQGPPNAKDFELLSRKTRKLQLEVDEKNEIINVLKDELETTKEQNDKFQRENIQLLKDSKRVEFLQDENDFLQDKVGNVDKLELEIKRLKEKLAETDFLKLRIDELEEDRMRAQDESNQFEVKWKRAEENLTRVSELESELNKWKSFSHELESEKNSIQNKLLESIEQETSLNSVNKQVEDEVLRLRLLIKSYEEQREPNSDITEASTADTSIKFELDKQFEKELNEENINLRQKLGDQEGELNKLLNTNKEILSELESNKKLIFDLRQDFACEKSLALKLTKQLASFTKQIKSLDKQYFPMHETSLVTHDAKTNCKKVCLEVATSDQHRNKTDTVIDSSPVQSSRQLNALIDTDSDQRLMLSMLHQNNGGILQPLHQKVGQPQRGTYAPLILPPDNAELNEQQIAHLANLHHQHYYHHLRHMHQIHKMHHQHYLHLHHHRLHHKYQQQQTSPGGNGSSNQVRVSGQAVCSQQEDILTSQPPLQRKQNEPIYTGGSQFYAPSIGEFDQVYANMTTSNNINQLNEHQHRTRLVSTNSNSSINNKQQSNLDQMAVGLRSSPSRANARMSPQKANHPHQHLTQSILPQIDEVNGLPTVEPEISEIQSHNHNSTRKQQTPAPVLIGSEATPNNSSSNQSPQSSSSSSPTSSASSNLSPSSASSSSSLNLLSSSSAPFNRSALRSTTTNLGRRQFSIERDLIEALPKTATLSRVGSCRATTSNRPSTEVQMISCVNRQLQCEAQMRTPVKCQQPSMRTSKILSIGQQSGAQQPVQQQQQHQHHQQREREHSSNQLNGRRMTLEKDRSDKLTGNLANIRLSDSLAFTSLRAPKSSSGVGSINRNLLTNNNNNINGQQTSAPSAKILSASATNAPDRRRQSNTASNVNGGNKSSVWFEYGCV